MSNWRTLGILLSTVDGVGKMARKAIGFRIPEDWCEEIQRQCGEQGISVSDFLVGITAKALEKDASEVSRGYPLLEAQRAVQSRLTTLEQSLALLTTRLTELEKQEASQSKEEPDAGS